jgi:hypothetical protein
MIVLVRNLAEKLNSLHHHPNHRRQGRLSSLRLITVFPAPPPQQFMFDNNCTDNKPCIFDWATGM